MSDYPTRPTGQQIVDTHSRIRRAVNTCPELELIAIETWPHMYGVMVALKYQRREYRLYCEYDATLKLNTHRMAVQELGRSMVTACERARRRHADNAIEYVTNYRTTRGKTGTDGG